MVEECAAVAPPFANKGEHDVAAFALVPLPRNSGGDGAIILVAGKGVHISGNVDIGNHGGAAIYGPFDNAGAGTFSRAPSLFPLSRWKMVMESRRFMLFGGAGGGGQGGSGQLNANRAPK